MSDERFTGEYPGARKRSVVERVTVTSGDDAPEPPRFCMVTDCECEADVIVLRVRNSNGRLIAGASSQFLETLDPNKPRKLRSGFKFHSWVTRCNHHYTQDLVRKGKLDHLPEKVQDAIMGRGIYRNPDGSVNVEAYRELLLGPDGMMAKAIADKVIKS